MRFGLNCLLLSQRHDVNANSLEDIGYEDADAKQYEKIVLDDKFKKQVHGFDYGE